jgi:uncharacterized protein (DUF1501 family)
MNKKILIIINLRGGADAVNIVVPYGDQNYYRLRPTLSIPQPGRTGRTVIDLDGFFGMHPSLEPLLPFYQQGRMAFLHAVGWPGDSHSHFQAWEEIEAGVVGEARPTTGWLARYLQLLSPTPATPLRAVAFDDTPSKLLMGALGASTIRNLEEFRLAGEKNLQGSLRALYGENKSSIGRMGIQILDSLDAMEQLLRNKSHSGYPHTSFGEQLRSVERLIRAGVGLEAASVDLYGWDTHFLEGTTDGLMARLLAELATGISAFMRNLEDRVEDLLVVVMSEFGRRVLENGSGGTDHGQGGVMIFLGGAVSGGRVYGEWPGLADSQLAGPGDIAITTDFRGALGEIVSSQLGERAVGEVFPGYRVGKRLGFIKEEERTTKTQRHKDF